MYTVDEHDEVVELAVPQSCTGAPCPFVLAGDLKLVVVYWLHNPIEEWDGKSVRVIGPASEGEAAVVRFKRPLMHRFGMPNDEAFAGHPLASRGLEPSGTFEVLHSSWIRALERMNSVHRLHTPAMFSRYRHFVWSFHDETFECVATDYTVETADGPLTEIVSRIAAGT